MTRKTVAESVGNDASRVEAIFLNMLCDALVQDMREDIEYEHDGYTVQAFSMDNGAFIAISGDKEGLVDYFATDDGLPGDDAEREELFISYIEEAKAKK